MKGCCCGCEFKKSCRGLLDKLWLYYTHYHLFVVLNIAIVTTCVVMPILKTNFEYRYGRLPCDPVFTPLILSGRKYGNLQKFKVRLSFGDHLLELLMFGAYYLSAALSFIAHVFRNKTSCVLHHVAVGITCFFGLCFAYVSRQTAVWADGMVKGLASLRDLRIECYEPYQALDMQRYVRLSLFLVVFVSLWDLCVTRSFEKKYLMAPFSWGFASKLCDYARSAFPSLYERFTKKQQPQQPQPELNSIEMI